MKMEILQIVTNVVVQIIILLYLIDNNEQTSWMILASSGIGVLIEAWKVCHENSSCMKQLRYVPY